MGKNSKKNKRKKKITRHHIKNTCNGGGDEVSNIIFLKNEKHQCWHNIFHNLDFVDAARLLVKAYNLKNKDDYMYYEIVKKNKGLFNIT